MTRADRWAVAIAALLLAVSFGQRRAADETASDRVIEGSTKNSISSVPIMNWPGTQTSAIPRER